MRQWGPLDTPRFSPCILTAPRGRSWPPGLPAAPRVLWTSASSQIKVAAWAGEPRRPGLEESLQVLGLCSLHIEHQLLLSREEGAGSRGPHGRKRVRLLLQEEPGLRGPGGSAAAAICPEALQDPTSASVRALQK